MIASLIYTRGKQELKALEGSFRYEAALAGDDEWKWLLCANADDVAAALPDTPVLDLSCIDVTGADGTKDAEEMRSRYREMMMMVIADAKMSPMQYLKPSILPAALLMRPYTAASCKAVIHDFVTAYMEAQGKTDSGSYVLEQKEGKTFLPYSKIAYFEARQKKIFVRVGSREYAAYETIDNLMQTLPAEFLRCHRSYIINRKWIDRIILAENLILLTDGSMIPVSRSYRAEVKALS